jgi:protein TonB
MRRRRQKGIPLLWKILGVSVLVHIIALPILARFGVLAKVERQFTDVQMVTLPPPETEKPKPAPKEAVKKAPRVAAVKRSNTGRPRSTSVRQNNLIQPKVVVAQGGPGGGEDNGGPTVDPNGTGTAGELPTGVASTPSPVPTPAPESTPAEPAPTPIASNPIPVPTPTAIPTPVPTPQPTPRLPTFTEPVPVETPKPALPDSLRSDTLDRTTVAEFVVGTDGTPVQVRVIQSAGISDLDQLALDAARQWRFKPATRDGVPIQSTVRLHIAFQVL